MSKIIIYKAIPIMISMAIAQYIYSNIDEKYNISDKIKIKKEWVCLYFIYIFIRYRFNRYIFN